MRRIILHEWLAPPLDADVDILDVRGQTSALLHHFVLYSTTDEEPVGTKRPPEDSDRITLGLRFCGGVGGDSQGALQLPDGVVFRLAKGRSLITNVHYINTSAKAVVGRGWIDVKLAPAAPERKPAGMFTSVEPAIAVAPHAESTLDVSCTMQHDVNLIAWTNHMHELGASVFTEVERTSGTIEEIRRDDAWQYEWALDPQFTQWPLKKPFKLHAGDVVHTRCVWNNPGPDLITFPREMCLGLGFFVGPKDVTCSSGKWLE
ncbi:MAG: hypothetical protein QM820_14570 [Minicystis sp.]